MQTSFLDLVVLSDGDTSLVIYSFVSGLRLPPSARSLRRDGDTAPHAAARSQGGNLTSQPSSGGSTPLWWVWDHSHTDQTREGGTVTPSVCLEARALQDEHRD